MFGQDYDVDGCQEPTPGVIGQYLAQPAERDIRSYRKYAMADIVDSSAYAYDIDSSLERLMSLADDESSYYNFKDSGERGPPPGEALLQRICYTHAVALRLRFTWQDGHDLEPWCQDSVAGLSEKPPAKARDGKRYMMYSPLHNTWNPLSVESLYIAHRFVHS